MKDLFSSIYLVSKVAAALLNAFSVVLFVRLAGDAAFGRYLIAFAFAFIAFSFATQWLLSAHFGRQSPARAPAVAGAAIVMVLLSLPAASLIVLACAGLGLVEPSLVAPAIAMVAGLGLYYVMSEIGRAQLLVGAVALGGVLRASLALALGGLALATSGTAEALLAGVAAAHILAACPMFLSLRRTLWAAGFVWPARAEMLGLARYGAPLVVAAGASALALMIDRILLDQALGAAVVGPYGAVLDFTKQSFIIVGETVTVSYVAHAKALHGDGRSREAREMLAKASATIAFLAVMGLVFFLLFGEALFARLFGLEPGAMSAPLLWLAAGNACLLVRAYYVGQVIYFTGSARLELRATLIGLGVGIGLGLWLIPIWGVLGAAASFALTQGAALGVFLAHRETRATMPVDLGRAGLALAAGLGVAVLGLMLWAVLPEVMALTLALGLMTAVCAVLVLRWDLFDAQLLWRRLRGLRV